jgi:hypothetical protein
MSITEIDKLTNGRAYKILIYPFSNPDGIISFPAFITSFVDSYKSNWKTEEVLGKMDPIATYKNTNRSISLGFDIPSDSIETAQSNLRKIDLFIKGLYPVYDSGLNGTSTLSSPPMFRVRFSNLIRNASSGDEEPYNTLRSGLLCYTDGFDFKPSVESGFFVSYDNLYPKLLNVNLNLKIIHEHPLGKTAGAKKLNYRDGFASFPHDLSIRTAKTNEKQDGKKKHAAKTQPTNTNEESHRGCAAMKINLDGEYV